MRKIIVTVIGGRVMDVTALNKGESVEVEVRDYDVCVDPGETDKSLKRDEEGEWYKPNVFEL